MDLLTPEPGLLLWSLISFGLLVFLLGKFAWKPILQALKVREETIEFSLKEAEKARHELVNLEKTKKQLMEEARIDRDNLLKEARDLRNTIIEESRETAKKEAEKILIAARMQIEAEKSMAIDELKKQVALLSVEIAGKILHQELNTANKQQEVINHYLKEVNFN
jgi:F-type H+-transporting ATPase subunit b